MYNFAPLGLLMLISSMRERLKIEPEIFDINSKINSDEIKNDDQFYHSAAKAIIKDSPDVVGFMTECDSYHHVLQICHQVKALMPSTYIVLGGPHATAVAFPTMEKWHCIDGIVLGEGEVTFCELLKSIQDKTVDLIDGAITRNSIGQPITGGGRPLVEALDELPFPAYDKYESSLGEELFLEVGRGCPFQCTFCSTSPFWHRRHRVKSPGRILQEIQFIRSHHPHISRLHFTHDLFTANQNWVRAVCETLIAADLKLNWTCSSRIDTVNEDLLKLMHAAGCNAIYFGVESGSDEILNTIRKEISFEETKTKIELCHDLGINANAGFILGFPSETVISFKDTFTKYHQLIQIGAKPVHIFSFCPFAQSSMYDSLKELSCSGNFIDIPLSPLLENKNRTMIANDVELFGSYFRPRYNISGIDDKTIYAIDEFSLLADALRLPLLVVAQTKSIDVLFFEWLNFIETRNTIGGKAEYRKYMGRPVDFSDFLLLQAIEIMDAPIWLIDLIQLMKANFGVSSSLSLERPITMETYKSNVLSGGLTKLNSATVNITSNILEKIQLSFDVTEMMSAATFSGNENPVFGRTNLVWQENKSGSASLIRVDDFIYHVLCEIESGEKPISDICKEWIKDQHDGESINLNELEESLKMAFEKDLLIVNS